MTIHAMSGKMHIESEKGKGTVFTNGFCFRVQVHKKH
jgi:hypothetical protein